MASRRLRIKPIANVPVRRGKVNTENERSDSTIDAVTSKLTLSEPKSEVSSRSKELSTSLDNAEIEQNTSRNEVSTVNFLAAIVDNTNFTSTLHSDNAVTTEKDCSLVAIKKEFVSPSESSKDAASNFISKKVVPPGLVRNRVKPTVSVSAVSRRPRELSKISNESKVSDSSLSQIDHGKDVDGKSKNVSDKPHVVSSGSSKDIGAGVPGITQVIPTGTAIRPQHDIIGPSTPVVGRGEAPQSTYEPDLPSEGAGSGDNILSSEVNIKQKSRFIKPSPHVVAGIQVIHKPGDANESQKSFPSDNVLPYNTTELIVNDCRFSESKQGGGTSASESDDESRRSFSEASTITPPVRKSTEISRPRFVKPTPRFIEASARRNSIQSSASESEDESRRSVSLASTITPPNKRLADLKGDEPAEQNGKEDCVDLPEKKTARSRRTQSSCTIRLAKARMDFQNKFGNRAPDRSRLTMFDLIFYNPTTNPMKSSEQENTKAMKTTKLDDNDDEKILEERLAEEQVDEPTAPDDIEKDKSDAQEEEEDMAMPVPQVKVGPDGQIILDEKSLVIETTGAKKSREDLANSAVIVDYGNGSTGYGTYSNKNRKSKEWSKEETLKFYRALNRVGTDFSLMQSIFPKRTRQDLKAKYKKEDRLNRYLVEKALLYPLDFDLTDLEKELEKEEQEAREKAAQKLMKPVPKKKNMKYKMKHGSFLMRSMNAADTGSKKKHSSKKRKSAEPVDDQRNAKRFRAIKDKPKGIESGLSSDEENELNYNYETDLKFNTGPDDDSRAEHDTSDYESAELEYLTKPPKPTRSGRVPQPRKLVEIEDSVKVSSSKKKESNASGLKSSLKNIESQPMPLEDLTNVESKTSSKSYENELIQPTTPENHAIPLENLTDIEPGSLVVLATQSPTHPGHQVYKVFMVTPNVPINVPLSTPLSDSFVHENSESCNEEPSEQVGNVPEFMSTQQDESLPGQLAELLPVKQSESIPSQVSGFLPVHDAEPLTSQLVQFLPVLQAQSLSPLQAENSSNEVIQFLPDGPHAVFSSQQEAQKEVADERNKLLSVQQVQSQSDQPVQLESPVETGT